MAEREGERKERGRATRVLIGMIPLICALCMLGRADGRTNTGCFHDSIHKLPKAAAVGNLYLRLKRRYFVQDKYDYL